MIKKNNSDFYHLNNYIYEITKYNQRYLKAKYEMQNESGLNDFLSSLKPGESMILRVSSLLFKWQQVRVGFFVLQAEGPVIRCAVPQQFPLSDADAAAPFPWTRGGSHSSFWAGQFLWVQIVFVNEIWNREQQLWLIEILWIFLIHHHSSGLIF